MSTGQRHHDMTASPYQQAILSNGLQIVTHTMPQRSSIALGLWLAVGGRHEPAHRSGLSHFLEHMVFKGTTHRSARQIKESIEGIGGSINAFTGEEFTCFFVKVPSAYLERGVEVLADMALSPRLTQHDIDRERTVIIEEIRMYRDQPGQYVYELLDQLLWPDQPLGLSLAGSEQTVARINHVNMTAYRRRYYVPRNMVLAAAGAIEHDIVLRLATRIFGRIAAGIPSQFRRATVAQRRPQMEVAARKVEQAHLCLGLHALRRQHPDRHAVNLLHVVLGANMSSRLFQEVREERGLAYDIGTHIKVFHDTGAMIVNAGVDPDKLVRTVSVVIKQLMRCTQELVTAREFEQAREFYLGQTQLALEETIEHMFWIGETSIARSRLMTFDQVAADARRVTREDLRRVARRLFRRQRINVSVVGNVDRRHREQLAALIHREDAS